MGIGASLCWKPSLCICPPILWIPSYVTFWWVGIFYSRLSPCSSRIYLYGWDYHHNLSLERWWSPKHSGTWEETIIKIVYDIDWTYIIFHLSADPGSHDAGMVTQRKGPSNCSSKGMTISATATNTCQLPFLLQRHQAQNLSHGCTAATTITINYSYKNIVQGQASGVGHTAAITIKIILLITQSIKFL